MDSTISLDVISQCRKGRQLKPCDDERFYEIMEYCTQYCTVLQHASGIDAHKKSLAVQLAAITVLDFVWALKTYSDRRFAADAKDYVLKTAHRMSFLHVITWESVGQLCTNLYLAMSAEYEENRRNVMVAMEGCARLKLELVHATETLLASVEDSAAVAAPQARAAASMASAAALTACVARLVVEMYDIRQILNGLVGIRNWPISIMPVTPLDPVCDALMSFSQLIPEQRSGALPGILQQFNKATQAILNGYSVKRSGCPDRYCYYDSGDGTVMMRECNSGFLQYLGHYCEFFHRGLTTHLPKHLNDPVALAPTATAAMATAAPTAATAAEVTAAEVTAAAVTAAAVTAATAAAPTAATAAAAP